MKAGWPAKQEPSPDSVETPIQVGKRDFGSRMVPPRRRASNQMAKAFTWVRPSSFWRRQLRQYFGQDLTATGKFLCFDAQLLEHCQ